MLINNNRFRLWVGFSVIFCFFSGCSCWSCTQADAENCFNTNRGTNNPKAVHHSGFHLLEPSFTLIAFALKQNSLLAAVEPLSPSPKLRRRASKRRRRRKGAFRSFFQIGWPRLWVVHRMWETGDKKTSSYPAPCPLPFLLPVTPPASPHHSSSLHPAFPAHVIVWMACSRLLLQLTFCFPWIFFPSLLVHLYNLRNQTQRNLNLEALLKFKE